jgi:hypothetical protein
MDAIADGVLTEKTEKWYQMVGGYKGSLNHLGQTLRIVNFEGEKVRDALFPDTAIKKEAKEEMYLKLPTLGKKWGIRSLIDLGQAPVRLATEYTDMSETAAGTKEPRRRRVLLPVNGIVARWLVDIRQAQLSQTKSAARSRFRPQHRDYKAVRDGDSIQYKPPQKH